MTDVLERIRRAVRSWSRRPGVWGLLAPVELVSASRIWPATIAAVLASERRGGVDRALTAERSELVDGERLSGARLRLALMTFPALNGWRSGPNWSAAGSRFAPGGLTTAYGAACRAGVRLWERIRW